MGYWLVTDIIDVLASSIHISVGVRFIRAAHNFGCMDMRRETYVHVPHRHTRVIPSSYTYI